MMMDSKEAENNQQFYKAIKKAAQNIIDTAYDNKYEARCL